MNPFNKNNLTPKFNKFILITLIVILSLSIAFFIINQSSSFKTSNITVIDNDKIYSLTVEIAQTDQQQKQGLMNRTNLAIDKGMLFIFSGNTPQAFWMKDTLIPLDIIFFNSQGNFLNADESAQPCLNQGDNCKNFTSDGNAKYVLEVEGGWIKTNNLDKKLRIDLNSLKVLT